MAKLIQLSDTSWEQPFRDRKKEHLLWGSHPAVREHCKFVDGTRRLLQIAFDPRFDLDIVDYFQITSGREIQFPKVLVEMIRPVVLKNPESSFIVTVLDANGGLRSAACSQKRRPTVSRLARLRTPSPIKRYAQLRVAKMKPASNL